MYKNCQARIEADGQWRCTMCRLVWDRDELESDIPCPRLVNVSPPLQQITSDEQKFVSALAPDIFSQYKC